MSEQLINDFDTALDGGIDDSQVTFDVLATPGAGPNFRVRIGDELMLVTGVAGLTWTVTRGIEGTTPAAHSNAAPVYVVITAAGLQQWGDENFADVAHVHAASAVTLDGSGFLILSNTIDDVQEFAEAAEVLAWGQAAAIDSINTSISNHTTGLAVGAHTTYNITADDATLTVLPVTGDLKTIIEAIDTELATIPAAYTTEEAQDAVGAMVTDGSLVYVDGTPLLTRGALTGAITASQGSNTTALGSFTKAQLDGAVSDGNVLYVGDITQYTDELAQDAVGGMAANSARVTLTYVDGTPSLTADLVAASVAVAYMYASTNNVLFGRTTTGAGAGEEIVLDTDGTLAADSDTRVATQKAVKTYVAANAGGTSLGKVLAINAGLIFT